MTAWRAYRDGPARYHARRALRKREFIAGWRARSIHQIALEHNARTEGAVVPPAIVELIATGKIIQAVKELRSANAGMLLFDAKRIVERLRDELEHG
ncbi:hypothetical protein HMPREF1529_02209 [Microbacterium sp. oral taxon 186 str. F0373]|uniref:hypothetical protein n=1 Tax=Microbacterium sp. oral taxon 186 TaxID=712383 RepID=UPI00034E9474|nr:hypothetical protein [Microbacterium sp. oral taxon 186]EPD84169.1 hypothetical protein HMPREF1529_02209 [Microbacterium sp. oral taxon 186 str. F0373]